MIGSDPKSLVPGKRAALTAVDILRSHLVPSPGPVGTIVSAACGFDVSHVVVDGRLPVKRPKILPLDERGILERAAKTAKERYARTGIEIPVTWPVA